jgi:hypothetical protein
VKGDQEERERRERGERREGREREGVGWVIYPRLFCGKKKKMKKCVVLPE